MAINAITIKQEKSFIFAFPNSTHAPWRQHECPDSKITLLNSGLHPDERDQLLGYANALNHVDQLMGMLVDTYQDSGEKTLIVVVGDHQPAIRFYHQNWQDDKHHTAFLNHVLKKYRTAFVAWSNYELKRATQIEYSMNLLPALIIKQAGVKTTGFMKFVGILEQQLAVVSHLYKAHGEPYSTRLSAHQQALESDYELLQYDLLFGENYLSQ